MQADWNATACTDSLTWQDSASRYIVRLASYQPLSQAQDLVAQLLAPLSPWQLAARSPLAHTFDTDFCVIQALPSAIDTLTSALLASSQVRDVHEDRVIRQPLMHHDSRSAPAQHSDDPVNSASMQGQSHGGAHGAARSHGSSFAAGEGEDGISKKGGRLQTKWSWPEGSLDALDATAQREHAETVRARFAAHTAALQHSHSGALHSVNAYGPSHNAHAASKRQRRHSKTDRGLFPAGHEVRWGAAITAGSKVSSSGGEIDHASTGHEAGDLAGDAGGHKRRLRMGAPQVTAALQADGIWRGGHNGKGIRVGERLPVSQPYCRCSA